MFCIFWHTSEDPGGAWCVCGWGGTKKQTNKNLQTLPPWTRMVNLKIVMQCSPHSIIIVSCHNVCWLFCIRQDKQTDDGAEQARQTDRETDSDRLVGVIPTNRRCSAPSATARWNICNDLTLARVRCVLACVAPGCTVLYVYAFVFLPTVHTSYGLLPLCREQSRRTLKVEIEAATPYPIARALQQPMQSTQKVSKRHPRRTQEAPRGTEKVYIYIYIHMRIYIYIYIYIQLSAWKTRDGDRQKRKLIIPKL